MPLTPPLTTAEVISIGALRPEMLRFPDLATLNVFVQSAIDYADSWMAGNMGAAYDLQTPFWAPIRQHRGQAYLALEAIYDTLKATVITGTHFAYDSEESASYEALIDNEWGARARESLDIWLTIERVGAGFALPYFGITQPVPIVEDGTNGLDPLVVLYEEMLARARGFSNLDQGTVIR